MNDLLTPLRLLAALLVLVTLPFWLTAFVDGIPLVGALPGDIEVELPTGMVYLPITTSLLAALLLTAVATAIQKLTRK